MRYQIRAPFLLGTSDNPGYRNLTEKQAIKAGNELAEIAFSQGWHVDGEFTAAPQTLTATKDDLTRYITIDED